MEILHQATLFFILLSLIIPRAISLTLNTSYFIQCGLINSTFTHTNESPPRTFVSDEKYLISGSTSTNLFPNVTISTNPLYPTARFSFSPFSYQFNVVPNTSNILRLHFSPFSGSSNANFAITTFNGNSSTNNFSISALTSLIIKEFFLSMDSDKLVLKFTPQNYSIAFISVIEIFDAAPLQLFSNIPILIDTTDTFNTQQAYLSMETFYRVNMPGPLITPENDTLWRTWVTDDPYIYNAHASQTHSVSMTLNFNPLQWSSEDIAPETVYNTARMINASIDQFNSNPDFNINITWSFRVDSGYYYLIRLHFCDIIPESSQVDQGPVFAVYIMDYLALRNNLRPSDYTSYAQEPFYIDFIANVMGARNITVSISLDRKESKVNNGFLNGLEIMKMTNYNPPLERKKKLLAIILGPTIGGAFIILILMIMFGVYTTWYKGRCKMNLREEDETPFSQPHQYSCRATSVASPRLIAFSEIKTSTNNFDERSLIGVGGFGKVYKGRLHNGTMVAVKRASCQSNQGFPEFQTEIEVLSNIRHRHLLSLIGYCDENSEMILVYEYMEKGTLRNYLYGTDDLLPSLSWKQRLEICIGTAKGLQYLHTGPSRNIIHRDVKSTNILLGEGYIAKVSDFGISKLGPCIGETHVSTAVKGSFGYLDPEYFKTQQLTDKSDVYSFGVVLFEVLCARPVIDQSLEREQLNLTEWALMWQRKGELEKIIDPKLVGEIKENSLRKFGEIAKECLEEYGIDRPTMGDVLWNLEYCLRLQETEVKSELHYENTTSTSDSHFLEIPTLCGLPSNISSADSRSDITTSNVFF
ncbi:receptor-like protein kinase [Carex littledalei]|uniref:Receptor-like protein kinase n=1 Tax=Carex littledalei TaxID=544730 RepID=A0A833RK85_9POAL|nr:receptor-like protein kinase [Carex littledalei]